MCELHTFSKSGHIYVVTEGMILGLWELCQGTDYTVVECEESFVCYD